MKKLSFFFKALVVLDPKNAYDAQTLAAIYLQMGDAEETIPTLNTALALDPTHEPTLLNKAKALLTQGSKKEAFEILPLLTKSKDPLIADDASALLLAYS